MLLSTGLAGASPQDSVTVTFAVVVPAETPDDARLFWAGSLNRWDPGHEGTGFHPQDFSRALTDAGDGVWRIAITAPEGAEEQYNYTRGSIFRVEGAPDYTYPAMRAVVFDEDKTVYDTVAVWRDLPPEGLADQWPVVPLEPADLTLTRNGQDMSESFTFLGTVNSDGPMTYPEDKVTLHALPEGVTDPMVYADRLGAMPESYLLFAAAETDDGAWALYLDHDRDQRLDAADRILTVPSDTSAVEWTGTVQLTDDGAAIAKRETADLTLRHATQPPEQIIAQIGEGVPVFLIQKPMIHRAGQVNGRPFGVSTQLGTTFSNFFYLTVDRDGSGSADLGSGSDEVVSIDRGRMFRQEQYFLAPTVQLEGNTWEVAHIDPAGTELRLRPAEAADAHVAIREGEPAPAWEATTMAGEAISSSILEGKYVLLDFWGSWCAPCIDALPKLADVYERFGDEQFELVGFAYESEESLTNALERHEEITWPQILDDAAAYSTQFAVRSYPTYYLIDPEGIVVATGNELRGDNLVPTLERFLDDK